MNRDELRKSILARRDLLTKEVREAASEAIARHLPELPLWHMAHTILFYLNFRSEVETRSLLDHALEQGKRVCAPRTITRDRRLLVHEINEPGRDLRPGYCGIPEPDPATCPLLEPARLDLVLVPGSVFDRQGGRLGYGGGYYDRFFSNHAPQASRLALCYEMQLVDKLPLQPHDVAMQFILTEKQLLSFDNR